MKTIEFFTVKKNTDLDCLSATQTIRQFFDFKEFKSLKKFDYWKVCLNMSKVSNVNILERITKDSFLICNPNKEEVLYKLPDHKYAGTENVHVYVKNNITGYKEKIKKLLNQNLKLDIMSIEHKKMWLINVVSQNISDAKKIVSKQLFSEINGAAALLYNSRFESIE